MLRNGQAISLEYLRVTWCILEGSITNFNDKDHEFKIYINNNKFNISNNLAVIEHKKVPQVFGSNPERPLFSYDNEKISMFTVSNSFETYHYYIKSEKT
ncbi:hypothetical protein H8356DRAFT_1329140 [Neocallimastix lanati (nom. inval.)]|nr:hypothetical protein H8356DRAFT_1329140 [Neocallimastix sp. JGI-2020a]